MVSRKYIDNWGSKYIIYSDGRVYSTRYNKFLKGDINRGGYHTVTLYYKGNRKTKKIHRLVAEAFIPKVEGKDYVNHIDGDKDNNDVSNLEWCTVYENNLHARKTGLNDIASSNHNRWSNDEFRIETSRHISEARVNSGIASGCNNPRYKKDLLYKGKMYSTYDLAKEINKSYDSVNHAKNRMMHRKGTYLKSKFGVTYIN